MKPTVNDISVGAIIFRRRDSLEFLLLKNKANKWEFSKGHLQVPDFKESAIIEVKEETGFDSVEFFDGFFEKVSYIKEFPKEIANKSVYFFLMEKDDKITLSPEHSEYCWKNLEECCSLMEFDNQRGLLKKASEFVNSKVF